MKTKIDDPKSRIDNAYDAGAGAYSSPGESDLSKSLSDSDVADSIAGLENQFADQPKVNNPYDLKSAEQQGGSGIDVSKLSAGKIKKKGINRYVPAALLGGGLTGGAILFSLSQFALLPISLMENLTGHNDSAGSSMQRRITGLLGKKLSNTADPLCNTKAVKCKMGQISTKGLKKLSNKGFVAFDADGNDLTKSTSKYPEKRPAYYEVEGRDGKISVENIQEEMVNDKKLGAKLLGRAGAFNMRWKAWTRGYIKAQFFDRFRMSRLGGLADGTYKNSKIAKTLESLKGKFPKISDLSAKAGQKISAKTDKYIGKGKRGGLAYLGAVGTCMALKVPGMIAYGVAAVQLARLLPLVQDVILSPGSRTKASYLSGIEPGDVTPAADLMTAKDSNGKSALDSAILLSALGINKGKTGPSASFTPGFSILTNDFFKAAKSAEGASESTCNVIMSPQAMYTAIAVNTAMTIAASATIIGGGIKVAAEFAISEAASFIIGIVTEKGGELIINEIAESDALDRVLGTPTGGLELGDALGISAMGFFSAGAAASHVPVLRKNQIQAYQEQQLELAQQDRAMDIASLSPFDTSSPYTFMGSITSSINRSLISTGRAGDTSGLSVLSYIASLPLSTLTSKNTASAAVGMDENYCGYAEIFGMDADDGMTPGVNAAGLPCFGFTGTMSTDQAIDIVTGQNGSSENWVEDEVAEEATIDEVAVEDTRLGDYITDCGVGMIENGEWNDVAAGCTIDTTSSDAISVGSGGTPICTQEQLNNSTPEQPAQCVSDSTIGETSLRASTSLESEAIAAFSLDYQISQVIDGFDEIGSTSASGGAGSSVSAATPAMCASLSGSDSAQIACSAYQFADYMYLYGGGHSGTAADFMSTFDSGGYPAGSAILDCSGLVRMAIYDTYGVDIGGGGSDSYVNLPYFEKIPAADAQPGDLLIQVGKHVEIVVENQTATRSFATFGAHSTGKPIGPASWFTYDNVSYALRWRG